MTEDVNAPDAAAAVDRPGLARFGRVRPLRRPYLSEKMDPSEKMVARAAFGAIGQSNAARDPFAKKLAP